MHVTGIYYWFIPFSYEENAQCCFYKSKYLIKSNELEQIFAEESLYAIEELKKMIISCIKLNEVKVEIFTDRQGPKLQKWELTMPRSYLHLLWKAWS